MSEFDRGEHPLLDHGSQFDTTFNRLRQVGFNFFLKRGWGKFNNYFFFFYFTNIFTGI